LETTTYDVSREQVKAFADWAGMLERITTTGKILKPTTQINRDDLVFAYSLAISSFGHEPYVVHGEDIIRRGLTKFSLAELPMELERRIISSGRPIVDRLLEILEPRIQPKQCLTGEMGLVRNAPPEPASKTLVDIPS